MQKYKISWRYSCFFQENILFSLERIPNCKMKSQTILEFRDIVISLLTRIVWSMKGNSQIQTNNQEC